MYSCLINNPSSSPLIQNQRGNIFTFVLLGVVLFAALVFVFTKGFSGSADKLTTAAARTHAADIINAGQAFERGVQYVLQNGTSESDVSFETGLLTGYDHTPAAATSAQVFHVDGGGVGYKTPLPDQTTSTTGKWLFTGGVIVTGQGDDAKSDLIATLPVSPEICTEINQKLGNAISLSSSSGSITGAKFTGTYADNGAISFDPGAKEAQGCIHGLITDGAQTGSYTYYKVLLVR
jgi:hypothetical protein